MERAAFKNKMQGVYGVDGFRERVSVGWAVVQCDPATCPYPECEGWKFEPPSPEDPASFAKVSGGYVMTGTVDDSKFTTNRAADIHGGSST